MPAHLADDVDETKLTSEEVTAAQDSSRTLARLTGKSKVRLQINAAGVPAEEIELPAAAVKMLARILAHMAKGETVTLMPNDKALTTNEAADFLNVSRPYLITLLESQQIPCQMVGKDRRVRLSDLSEYKRQMRRDQRDALNEMAELSQEIG